MDELLVNTKIATWIIGLLLGLVSTLTGFVMWYVLRLIEEARGLSGKISKNTYSILELKEQQARQLSALHTSEKGMWDELLNLRRAVVSGTLVLQRRKTETNQILEDQRRAKDQVAKHQKILNGHHQALKSQKSILDLSQSKLHTISEELFILKKENKGE